MLRETEAMSKFTPGRGRTALAIIAFVAASAVVRPAEAKLGEGLDLGAGRLKLGIDLLGRYDSSVLGKGDAIGKVAGKFQLNVKTETVLVDFGGGVGWNQYAGLAKNNPSDFSFPDAVAKGEIAFNNDRPVSFAITELFSRGDNTSNPIFGLGVLALQNHTKARLGFKPGGGAIDIGLSGSFDAGVYNAQVTSTAPCGADPTTCAGAINLFNSTNEMGLLDASWRLLPKTGLVLELGGGGQQYSSSKVGNQANVPATPLLGTLGFGTLITTRLSFSVKAGYQGLLFGNAAPAHHDVIGQAEIAYNFTDAIFGRVGGARLVSPVASNQLYFADNRIYLDTSFKVIQSLKLTLTGTLDIVQFGGKEQRADTSVGVVVGGDWAALDWLHVVANVVLSTRSSALGDPSQALAPAPASYSRVIALLGVTTMF